jgi:hypothetical protein
MTERTDDSFLVGDSVDDGSVIGSSVDPPSELKMG